MTGWLISILNWIFSWVNNYGWSVIIFTLLIKFVLLPLDIKSRKSMRAMNQLNPKMELLKQRYANDQEKLNRKMQELYRENHVNPLSGCLPLLIQMPILFMMFAAMRKVAAQQMVFEWAKNSGIATLAEDGSYVGLNWARLSEVTKEIETLKIDFGNTQSWFWIKSVFQADNMSKFVIPTADELASTLKQYEKDLTGDQFRAAVSFINDYLSNVQLSSQNRFDMAATIVKQFGIEEGNDLYEAIRTYILSGATEEITYEYLVDQLSSVVRDANALEFVKFCLRPGQSGLDKAAIAAHLTAMELNGEAGLSLKQLFNLYLAAGDNSVSYASQIDNALKESVNQTETRVLGLIPWTLPTKFNRYINGYYILPLLACGSQVLASKLQPTTPGQDTKPAAKNDPNAKPAANTGKIMQMVFPIISLFICWSSTAAFAIYWVFVNIWSIITNYGINFYLDWSEKHGGDKPKAAKTPDNKNKKEALQP